MAIKNDNYDTGCNPDTGGVVVKNIIVILAAKMIRGEISVKSGNYDISSNADKEGIGGDITHTFSSSQSAPNEGNKSIAESMISGRSGIPYRQSSITLEEKGGGRSAERGRRRGIRERGGERR